MGKARFPLINVRKDIFGKWHNNPFLAEEAETVVVPTLPDEYGHYTSWLLEIPDPNFRVRIEGLKERTENVSPSTLAAEEFFVNYQTGEILFHEIQAGKEFKVSYYGKGSLIEADDINDINDRLVELSDHISEVTEFGERLDLVEVSIEDIKGELIGVNDTLNSHSSEIETALGFKSVLDDHETRIVQEEEKSSNFAAGIEEIKTFDSEIGERVNNLEFNTSGDEALIRLSILEETIRDLKKESPLNTEMPIQATTVSYPDKDLVLTGSGTKTTGKVILFSKSVDIRDVKSEHNILDIKTSGDVDISNYSSIGAVAKQTSNSQMNINTGGNIKITNSSFGQVGYNCIEIGLSGTAPKNITIDNCIFGGKLDNNAINIFDTADNAIVTISNCIFESVSNVLRISNRSNVRATFNLIGCTINKWETESPWQGPIICQDYTSGSSESEVIENLFSPGKITINFIACVGPDGKKIYPKGTPDTYCGTKDENQLVIVYPSKHGETLEYDASRFPKVNFK